MDRAGQRQEQGHEFLAPTSVIYTANWKTCRDWPSLFESNQGHMVASAKSMIVYIRKISKAKWAAQRSVER